MCCIEMKLYEILGIKTFRKMAFDLLYWIALIISLGNKEKAKDIVYNIPSNYVMKKGNGLEDLRDFKKMLLLNTTIHVMILSYFVPNFFKIIEETASIPTTIFNLTAISINLYCIMLQRYNNIKINRILKKGEIKEHKQKEIILEELRQEKEITNDLTHIIVSDNKEKNITLEEFLQTATVQQLKEYKKELEGIKAYYDYLQKCSEEIDYDIPINGKIFLEKDKRLKLEFKSKR